ncbi:MAG: hypothetical protein ABIY70_09755 [Capsulimonas sp.]|uniref:hypothetical protein n=1 Tax=Capsulimonas sp. TaxID=2494211 RepID=UPI003267B9D4
MSTYIKISPRGFTNETVIYHGTAQEVAAAKSIINNHASAWAERIAASHPDVRRVKRLAENGSGAPIPMLTEGIVGPFRPQYLEDGGECGGFEGATLPIE